VRDAEEITRGIEKLLDIGFRFHGDFEAKLIEFIRAAQDEAIKHEREALAQHFEMYTGECYTAESIAKTIRERK
jgi:hypothetical protein